MKATIKNIAAGKKTVQIIGLGSPFGADRSGWGAVEYLQEIDFSQRFPSLQLEMLNCPSPALMPNLLQASNLLVVIDAMPAGTAGEVYILADNELAASTRTSSHGIGLQTLLPLLEVLNKPQSQMVVVGLGVGQDGVFPFAAFDLLEQRLEAEILRRV